MKYKNIMEDWSTIDPWNAKSKKKICSRFSQIITAGSSVKADFKMFNFIFIVSVGQRFSKRSTRRQ